VTPTESPHSPGLTDLVFLRRIDGAWLAALRVLLGLTLAVSMERFIAYGWIDDLLLKPRFHFKYWGFSWVQPLGHQQMHLLFHGLVGLGICVAVGLFFRVTAPLFALGLTYIQLIDVSTYLNHYYLAALLMWLLAVSPAHRMGSVDAWACRRLFTRVTHKPRNDISAVWLYLLRFQVGVVYAFAAVAKLQGDWLVHAQPLRMWLGASTGLPFLGPVFTIDGIPLLLSWCGFLYDASVVVWLSWKKTRPYAYVVVLCFHVFTRLLFDIGMFPWIMSVSALVFFSPSWPRHALNYLRLFYGRWRGDALLSHAWPALASAAAVPATAARWTAASRCGAALTAVYVGIQVILPLRFVAYGDNVLWHEQGMRWSWRVMVRAKGGSITFLVHDPSTGKSWSVPPEQYLTSFQESEMSGQPDLILQLAKHVAQDFQRRGHGPLEVRVDSPVSLNGRRAAPLIDPTIDLTTVSDGLQRFSWVMPAPRQDPPHIRPVL